MEGATIDAELWQRYCDFKRECSVTMENQEPDNEFKIRKIYVKYVHSTEDKLYTCSLCHIIVHLGLVIHAPFDKLRKLFKDKKNIIVCYSEKHPIMCMSCFFTKYVTMETMTGNDDLNDVRDKVANRLGYCTLHFTKRYFGAKTKRADDKHLVQG